MDSPAWVDDIERNAARGRDRIALGDESRPTRGWRMIGRATRAALVNMAMLQKRRA